MHTTQNHWMECPSRLCQEAILLACQLPKPGKTSLYCGMLACMILATPFPSDNNSPLTFKLTCCTCLLCFPLTLGAQMLPFFLPGDDISTASIRIFSHICLLPLEGSGSSSASLSSSESATKSVTVSAVISAADSAACSLRNYTQDK
jgi:threonine/homoserine efflux transporter RhtA